VQARRGVVLALDGLQADACQQGEAAIAAAVLNRMIRVA
jgi:hypothetical protein